MTLIEIGLHLIPCNPRHICRQWNVSTIGDCGSNNEKKHTRVTEVR